MALRWGLLVTLLALAVASCHAQNWYTVSKSASGYTISQGKDANGVAWGSIDNKRMQTGWDKLFVQTNAAFSEDEQGMAAGYLEGFVSWRGIWAVYNNFVFRMLENKPPAQQLTDFLSKQNEWTRKMMAAQKAKDPYWAEVSKLMNQFDGLVKGYNDAADLDKQMTWMQIYLFQSSGDLYDLIPAVVPHMTVQWSRLNEKQFEEEHMWRSSCSALIRLAPNGDLFAGHTTWTDYGSMVRTYKVFQWGNGHTTSFSSKPSLLYSKDDFYILSSGLVVMETTNGVRDESLYAAVTPESLLTWQRLPVVNALATDGKSWTDMMAKFNSGTYCNQWMVINYKSYVPGKPVPSGLVWIIEQIPGYSEALDVTSKFVALGNNWPSFNVPHSEYVYNVSGFRAAYEKFGDQYSYTKCPRAQIFRRDFVKVVDLDSMKFMLQYNDWKNDPLSLGSPANAISSRYDVKAGGAAFGGIDSKIVDFAGAKSLTAHAISGPTQQQPVFSWSSRYPDTTHMGEPVTFNFKWQTFTNSP